MLKVTDNHGRTVVLTFEDLTRLKEMVRKPATAPVEVSYPNVTSERLAKAMAEIPNNRELAPAIFTALKRAPVRYAGGTDEGLTHMGEPVFTDTVPVSRVLLQQLYRKLSLTGAVEYDDILRRAIKELKGPSQ